MVKRRTNKRQITLTIHKDLFDKIERDRGMISRSRYVEELLKRQLTPIA